MNHLLHRLRWGRVHRTRALPDPHRLRSRSLLVILALSLLPLAVVHAQSPPTIVSVVLQADGRYLVTMSDGTTLAVPAVGLVGGSLTVTPSGTQTVTGTVAATQSGAPWTHNLTQLAGAAIATGSGTASAGTQRVVLATDQPALTNALSAKITNGSQSADTVAGDSGQNSLLTAPARKVVTQTAQAVGALAAIDAGNYRAVSVQIVSQYSSSTVTPQCSNDNSTWTGLPLSQAGAPLGVNISSTSSTGVFYTSLLCLYFRLNITGTYTSGTFSATMAFFAQAGSANVQSFSNTGQIGGSSVVSTATGVQAVGVQGATSGGGTPFHLVSANTTNSTNVKASAGQLYGYTLSNSNAAVRYVKLYNKATAPTCGTDTPVMTVLVPPTSSVSRGMPVGAVYGSGIGVCATTGLADNDTGAVGASDLSIDLDYK